MLRNSVVILAMLLSGMATQVLALGLGTVTVESALNQPLRVRIEILELGDTRLDDVTVQLATLDDFRRFNIDRVGFLSNIRFAIEATPQGNFVLLTTNQIVREPYLSFILETRWPSGRLLSEHTILLDLPVFSDQQQSSEPVRQPISPLLEQPDSSPEPTRQPTPEPPALTPPRVPPQEEIPELSADEQEPAADATETGAELAEAVVDESSEELAEDLAAEAMAEEPEEMAEETAEPPAEAEQPEIADAGEPVVEDQAGAAMVADEVPEPETVEPDTVTTGADDTLTGIALQVRPDNSVSIQQTMVAIQQLNPDAFSNNNINQMRSGQVLRVPSLAEIQAVGAQQAIAEVSRQNQEFADRQPLAAPSDAQPDADQEPQGQLSVVAEDDTGQAIDASSGAGQAAENELAELDQRIAELENELAQQQEEADRARLEREALDSQLAELEDQIAAAQEIIRLQDLQLAQLQESLAQAAAEAEAQAIAAQQAAVAAAEQDALAAQQRGGLVNDILRILTGNIMMMVFGALLIILLLVVLLLRRNRASKLAVEGDELDELAEQEFDAAAREQVADQSRAEVSDELDSDEFDAELDELDAELDDIIDQAPADADADELDQDDSEDKAEEDAEDDLSRRAEQLVRDGHLDRAANLLQQALLDDADNDKLRLKLAEVLAKKGDLAAFEEQADLIAQAQSPILDREVNNYRKLFDVASPADADDAVEPGAETSSKPETRSAKQQADDESSFLDDLGIDLDSFDDDSFEFSDDIEAADDDSAKGKADKGGARDSEDATGDDLDDDMDLTFELGDGDEDSDASAAEDGGDGTADSLQLDAEPEDEAEAMDLTAEQETEDTSDDDSPLDMGDTAEPDTDLRADREAAGTANADDELAALDLDDTDDKAELAAGSSKDPEDVEIESFEFDADSFTAEPAKEPAKEDEEDLDLETFAFDTEDLGLDKEPEPEADTTTTTDDENAVEFSVDKTELESAAADDDKVEDLETFDFDLADTVVEKPPVDQPAPEPAGSDADDSDEFDFDLDEFEIEADKSASDSAAEPREETSESKTAQPDAGHEVEIDFDDDDDEQPAPDEDEDDEDLEDLEFLSDDDEIEIESVGDVEEVDMLSDVDEAATKLELAYAYQKMGDAEGAREILQEVLKEGNEDQVKEAEKLLASLDD